MLRSWRHTFRAAIPGRTANLEEDAMMMLPTMGHRTRASVRTAGSFPVLALLLVAAAGCDPAGGTAEGERPRPGGTAVVAGAMDLQVSNPLTVSEAWTQDVFRHALFLPLVRYGAEGGYEPGLAESWTMEGDSVVVFRLRRDVRWHDGAPTTAYDVAFTFERAKDPATGFPTPEYFEGWSRPEVLDSFTIRFHAEPEVDPLLAWAQTPPLPRHLLDSIPAAGLQQAAYNQRPVGNGPFRVVSHVTNDRWIFEANPDFPEALGGRPYLDRLVWRVVPENDAQVTELLTGSAHLITSPRADQLPALDDREGVRAIQRPTRKYLFVGWNGRRGALGQAEVRRGLAQAIDRARILAVARAGYGRLASTPVPPSHFAFDSAVAPLPYDTAAARALLARAGIRDRDGDPALETADGEDFTFELKIAANNAFNRDVAELMRADLARIGVTMTTRPTEGSTLIGDIISPERRFDAVLIALEAEIEDLKSLHLQSTQAADQAKAAVHQNADMLQKKLSERQHLLGQLDQAKMQEQMNTAMASLSEQVGQDVPITQTPQINTTTGQLQPIAVNANQFRSVGIILEVIPRITPDDTVVMEVIATRSNIAADGIPLFTDPNTGTTITSPIFNVTTARSTLLTRMPSTLRTVSRSSRVRCRTTPGRPSAC